MSYIVLARKYRPQKFDEVFAQEHITVILKNALNANKLAHALLFTGSRGVGKTSMARILAKSMNCLEGTSEDPCGKCDNCIEIAEGNAADVVEIDGASHTGVEDIRDLQKELMYSAAKSRYKVFIIDEVHMLSKNAFNALLKTLEEPPPQVIFIFATTEPHKVLPTIISRCQRYDFKRIPIDAIVGRLKYICEQEQISIEEEALYIIAKKAEGSLRDALSLTDQLIATCNENITANDVISLFGIVDNEVYQNISRYIHRKETAPIISLIHNLLDKGNDLQEFIGGYLDYLRNMLLLKTNVPLPELPMSLKEDLKSICELFSEDNILYLMSVLVKTKTEIKYFSNPILLVEMTFIKLSKMEEMKSISELLKDWRYGASPQPSAPAARQPHPRKNTAAGHTNQSPRKPAVSNDYTQKQHSDEKIKEYSGASTQYKEISKDVYLKEKENLLNVIRKAYPMAADFFSDVEFEKVDGKTIHFNTNSKAAYDYLNERKNKLAQIVGRFFRMEVSLLFHLTRKNTPQKEKIMLNPTLDDIKRKSPQLAEFIEKTNASVTPVKTNRISK